MPVLPISALQLNIRANPVSWRDVTSYARDFPLRQNIEIELGLSGTPEQFSLSLQADAAGLEEAVITSRFRWSSSLILQELSAEARVIDVATLLADTTMPRLQQLDAQFSGSVDVANYRQGRGDLSITAEQISRTPYQLDRFLAKGSLEGSTASLDLRCAAAKAAVGGQPAGSTALGCYAPVTCYDNRQQY
ncbi:MAG: hypothetical protein U5J63_03520 [Fodinibius sp.]|nr:hypothetical protein [Fodinibius sp.]